MIFIVLKTVVTFHVHNTDHFCADTPPSKGTEFAVLQTFQNDDIIIRS